MVKHIIAAGVIGICASDKEYRRMMRIKKKLHEDEISRTRASEFERQRNEFIGRKVRGGKW